MSRHILAHCLFVALLAMAPVCACSSDSNQPDSKYCSKDSDCLPVGVCMENACGTECTRDNMCPIDQICVLYRCVDLNAGDVIEDTAGKVACKKHIDCDPYELACINGFCDAECKEDWHCEKPGSVCQYYQCTQPSVADVPDARSPEEVVNPEDASPPDDIQVKDDKPEDALPPGCVPTNGPYGAACNCKEECETSLCVYNQVIVAGTCTQFCTNDNQCPGVDVCVIVDEKGVCVPNDSGQLSNCNPDMSSCYKGLVLTNKLNQCVCTTPCNTTSKCPDGFACHADPVNLIKYCISVGEMCKTGWIPCFGVCAGNPAVGQGFCTALCVSSADCPDGWTCTQIPEGNICNPQ